MLNDLHRPAGIGFDSRLLIGGLIFHLDCFIALALTGIAEKRQTALFGVIRSLLISTAVDRFSISFLKLAP